MCRRGHYCRLIEKWRQKDRAWPLLQIVVCGSPYQAASCDLCRRRKIMSHGGATQRGGLGDNSLAAFIELISVVFVAKHVFGDRSGAWRRFGIMSPAEAFCWRQVTHCVVLLSLRRDWAGDKNRCSWRQFACSYRLKLLPRFAVRMVFNQAASSDSIAPRRYPWLRCGQSFGQRKRSPYRMLRGTRPMRFQIDPSESGGQFL